MPLLIDAYNVLHTVGVLPPDLAGIDVQGLIGLLESSRYRHEKITLACDGVPQPGQGKPHSGAQSGPRSGPQSSIIVRYSGHGRPADDLIGQLVRASSAPRRLIVVSSDHAVLATARRRRCKTFSSQELLEHLAHDVAGPRRSSVANASAKPSPGGMTPEQIERWMSVFNIGEELPQLPAARPHSQPVAAQGSQLPAAPGSILAPSEPVVLSTQLPAGPLLPPDLIEQAEQLWTKENQADDPPENERLPD